MRAALEEPAVRSATGETELVVLWEDEDSIAWLNVARDPRDTGFHDHDGSSVGVYVIAGSVTNEVLAPSIESLSRPDWRFSGGRCAPDPEPAAAPATPRPLAVRRR